MMLVTKTSNQTRQRGHTLSTHSLYLYSVPVSPESLSFPPCFVAVLKIFWADIYSTNTLLTTLIPTSAQVSLAFHTASIRTTLAGFLALFRLSSTLPNPVFRLPSLGSGSQHDATVSLVLVGVALVLPSFDPPLLPLLISQALSALHSHSHYRSCSLSCSGSRSRFTSRPRAYPHVHTRTRPPFRSGPRPCTRRRFLPPVLRALLSLPYHMYGPALSLAREATGYLQAPPPGYTNDTACGIVVPDLLLCFFPDVAYTRAFILPTLPSPLLFPLPSLIPSTSQFPPPFSSRFRSRPVPIWCLSSGLHPRSRSPSRPVATPIFRSFTRVHPRFSSRSVSVPIIFHVSVLAPEFDFSPNPVSSFVWLDVSRCTYLLNYT